MSAVENGHTVVGLEISQTRYDLLRSGDSYIEDVTAERLAECLATRRYLPTMSVSDCEGFDVAIITVPTPLKEGAPDLSYVEAAATQIAPLIRRGATLVLESTTYPGTTEEVLMPILEVGSGLTAGDDFYVGYSPERIDPGNKMWHFENTPKVVSGLNRQSLEKIQSFYDTIVQKTIAVSGTREAELAKILENMFRHVNIALVNELAMFAADLGVDIWESIEAADSKPFGFMKFTPGPGVGGHCLPVDPSYLSWKVERTLGVPFRFVELANDVNSHMPEYVARRITSSLNSIRKAVNGSKVLLLGLAYKKNTSDVRESPAIVVGKKLLEMGAVVMAVDPMLAVGGFPVGIKKVELSTAIVRQADIVVILTDHDEFDWGLVSKHASLILDTRHRLSSATNVEYL